jgi:hypothetical protein
VRANKRNWLDDKLHCAEKFVVLNGGTGTGTGTGTGAGSEHEANTHSLTLH